MELSRARGSEEVVEVKEEKTTTIVTHNARPSRELWTDWDSPNLAEELVDRIWDMVRDWLRDREPAASDFFHYCLNLCDSRGEADEVRVWMLNLIAHFVAIPDCGWGIGLPAPTPTATAPSTPMWRPWEEDDEEEEVVNLSASVQKRKRRSPAAAARSRRRLQQWKEKKDKARLVSELRTTPWRPVKQIRSANLLERLDKYHFDVEGLTNVETLEEKKAKSTVFFSNHSQTSMLPQLTSPSLTPKTLHQTSPSEMISQVHIDRRCPSCCAWIMPVTTE